MNSSSTSKASFAVWAVRAAGFWLLLGAAAKLFVGTPKDLPQIVHDLTPFEIGLTFNLIIGVELALVCAAFLQPRLAWLPLVLLFVFFDFILVSQLGEKSCGCFGGSISVRPEVMMAIDSLLLVAMLATQPWKHLTGPGAKKPLVASTIVASFVLPWLVIDLPYWFESRGEPSSTPTTAATPAPGAQGGKPAAAPTLPGAQKAKPRYVTLKPEKWIGKSVFDVPELTEWVDATDKLPIEGKLILWRQGCEHCRDHLRAMAQEDKGDTPIALLQIRDDLTATSLIDVMPSGPHVTHLQFPDNQQFVVMTPWILDVRAGEITSAKLENEPH